jgi:hypothetical protein
VIGCGRAVGVLLAIHGLNLIIIDLEIFFQIYRPTKGLNPKFEKLCIKVSFRFTGST